MFSKILKIFLLLAIFQFCLATGIFSRDQLNYVDRICGKIQINEKRYHSMFGMLLRNVFCGSLWAICISQSYPFYRFFQQFQNFAKINSFFAIFFEKKNILQTVCHSYYVPVYFLFVLLCSSMYSYKLSLIVAIFVFCFF